MVERVFVSYAANDRDFALWLERIIRARGLDASSLHDVGMGAQWPTEMRKNITAAKAIVAVLPEQGAAGANSVFFEIGAAKTLNKPVFGIIPDRDRAERIDLPASLLDILLIDARHKSEKQVGDTLFQALQAA